MPLPEDVRDWLRSHFPRDQVTAASVLLDGAVDHLDQPAGPRLQRCAAFAAKGSLDALRQLVDLMKVDFRDVIVAGEYQVSGDDWIQKRDFNHPMADK